MSGAIVTSSAAGLDARPAVPARRPRVVGSVIVRAVFLVVRGHSRSAVSLNAPFLDDAEKSAILSDNL